jgi:hypothetical protein
MVGEKNSQRKIKEVRNKKREDDQKIYVYMRNSKISSL